MISCPIRPIILVSFLQVKHVKAWQDNKITIILKINESNTCKNFKGHRFHYFYSEPAKCFQDAALSEFKIFSKLPAL